MILNDLIANKHLLAYLKEIAIVRRHWKRQWYIAVCVVDGCMCYITWIILLATLLLTRITTQWQTLMLILLKGVVVQFRPIFDSVTNVRIQNAGCWFESNQSSLTRMYACVSYRQSKNIIITLLDISHLSYYFLSIKRDIVFT